MEKMKEFVKSISPPEVIIQRSVSTNSTKELTSFLLTQASSQSSSTNQIYTPIIINDQKWITTTINTIRKMFTPYKRPDEILDLYLNALKLIVIHHSSCAFDEIRKCFCYMSEPVPSSVGVDNALDFLSKLIPDGWRYTQGNMSIPWMVEQDSNCRASLTRVYYWGLVIVVDLQ